MKNNGKKRWGRRLGSTVGWAILVNVAYYICLFKGVNVAYYICLFKGTDLSWWTEYTRYMTYALGFLIGGLTITDAILHTKEKS